MKTSKGHCKNQHPIKKMTLLLMGRVVGVCPCGHKYLHSEMPMYYIGDKYSKSKERFHTYQFAFPLVCGECGKWIASVDVACRPLIEIVNDWESALREYLPSEDKENDV